LEPLAAGQIILLDTIGELASIYSIASVAFVGGSIVPAGGHNPLEPSQFGVPIVMGTHYVNFRTITEDLRAHDAIRIVPREEFAQTLINLLNSPADANAMGARARHVFEQQSGATDRTVRALEGLLAREARPA
jgi:3-deoxy-D-manno-octulosonic-acid transferase